MSPTFAGSGNPPARRDPPGPSPSAAEVADAVARAAAHRRTVHGRDERFAHISPRALEERITGLPDHPTPADRGWWRVGLVVDEVTNDEFRVWLHLASGRVRTQWLTAPQAPPQPPPIPPGLCFDMTRPRPFALPGWIHGIAGRAHCATCATSALRAGLAPSAVRGTPVVPGRSVRCVGCGKAIE